MIVEAMSRQVDGSTACWIPRGTCLLMVAALLYSSREYKANRTASQAPAKIAAETIATGPALDTGASTANG